MSSYSISAAHELLLTYFHLSAPTTIQELKSAYRAECKRLHPDLNPQGEEQFKILQSVYDFLSSIDVLQIICGPDSLEALQRTVDGTPLSDLGLGFGFDKNGRDCPDCNHAGYREDVPSIFHNNLCKRCLFGLCFQRMCRACKGTGIFTQKAKGKLSERAVECRACGGVGSFYSRNSVKCDWCSGYGYTKEPTSQAAKRYSVCYTCKGIGEIEILNPVLPKGLLLSFSTRL